MAEKKKQNEEQQQEETTDLSTINNKSNELFAGIDLEGLGFDEDTLHELSGLNNIDSSEIRIPYGTLISKKTKEHEVGDIVFPDGTVIKGLNGETEEEFCVLNVQPVRIMFPEPFNPKNSFICRSLDGKVGAPDGKYAGTLCAECEFSKYPPEGGASPCRDQRLLLCSRKDGSLMHIQVGGVGVKVWKQFMSAQAFHLLPKAKGLLGAIKLTLGTKMVDTDYGEFPALDFNVNSNDPFVDSSRLQSNLTALQSYKKFEREHAEGAATQSRVQMAAGVEADESAGENQELF